MANPPMALPPESMDSPYGSNAESSRGVEDRLREDFLNDVEESLATIETDLLALEQLGDKFEDSLINRIFRSAHSIKGACTLFGLRNLRLLSHALEGVLELFRERRLIPTPEIITTVLSAFDRVKELVSLWKGGDRVDIQGTLTTLTHLISSAPGNKPGPEMISDLTSLPLSISESELQRMQAEGNFVYFAAFDLIKDLDYEGKSLHDLGKLLKAFGNVLDAKLLSEDPLLPENAAPSSSLPFHMVFATCISPQEVDSILGLPMERFKLLGEPFPEPDSPEGIAEWFHGADVQAEKLPPKHSCPREDSSSAQIREATLRVKARLLDHLLSATDQIDQINHQLDEAIGNGDLATVSIRSQDIRSLTASLRTAIINARKQPIGTIFSRFPRMVRDLGRLLEKRLILEIEGQDTELETTHLDNLGNILIHLVRNAADHGIEGNDERIALGKPVTGRISLSATLEGKHILITVTDDGRGIDPEHVGLRALEKGLVSADHLRDLSPQQKQHLIFLPGLSTSIGVTELPGRGVGMDIVRDFLHRWGGDIELNSSPGKGTTFQLRLPAETSSDDSIPSPRFKRDSMV